LVFPYLTDVISARAISWIIAGRNTASIPLLHARILAASKTIRLCLADRRASITRCGVAIIALFCYTLAIGRLNDVIAAGCELAGRRAHI